MITNIDLLHQKANEVSAPFTTNVVVGYNGMVAIWPRMASVDDVPVHFFKFSLQAAFETFICNYKSLHNEI